MGGGAVVRVIRGKAPTGDRSGSGDGDGYGSGSGYGYSDGYGSGYGYGYGDGSGYGYGDGYWSAVARAVTKRWPSLQRKRLAALKSAGAFVGFWKSDESGRPCNGGSGDPVMAGQVQQASGTLTLCHRGCLHATLEPQKWKGERIWLVALTGKILRDGDKAGAQTREILGEVTPT